MRTSTLKNPRLPAQKPGESRAGNKPQSLTPPPKPLGARGGNSNRAKPHETLRIAERPVRDLPRVLPIPLE